MIPYFLSLSLIILCTRGDGDDDNRRYHGWHRNQAIQHANSGDSLNRAGSHFRRSTFPSATFDVVEDLPESQSYSNLGVYFLRKQNYRLAARFLSLANLIRPMGDMEQENWDALTNIRPKNYLCPWKENAMVGVGLKEDLTQIAIRISTQGNDRLALFYFAASCTGKIPSSLSCWTNLGVQLYRISSQIQAKIGNMGKSSKREKLLNKLNKLRSWAKYCFDSTKETQIAAGNSNIYSFLNRTVSKSIPFRRKDLRLKLCRRSETYERETEYFVEGILMMHSGLYDISSYYLKRAWIENKDSHVGINYAYSLFRTDQLIDARDVLNEILNRDDVISEDDMIDTIEFARDLADYIDVQTKKTNKDVTNDDNQCTEPEQYEEKNTWSQWRTNYLDRHERFASKNAVTISNDARYVVCVMPDVGLGNQVASIVSSFLLAHLTSRTLLFYWPPEMTHSWETMRDYIEFPSSSSSLLTWQYEDIVKLVEDPVMLMRNAKRMLVNQETEITDPETLEALLCGNLTKFMGQDSQFVFITSNVHFYRFLEVNPLYAKTIKSAFKNDDVFAQIAKFLIRPRPVVRKALNEFMKSKFSNRKYINPNLAYSHTFQDDKTLVIGLHLRSGMDENIRDVAILFNHDRDAVLRAAQKCLPAAIKRERSVSRYHEVVVIVACDNSRLRQKALNELVEIPGITKAVAFAPSKEASRGKTGMFYAVMDLFLLSQSDVIVRSGKMTSMFTTLASGLMIRGSMQPVYMAPVVTPTFYQCDTSNRACGVSLNRDSPKLGIVESVITNHNEDQVGTCFHGAVKTAEMLRNRGVLYPNCEELLSIDSRAHGGAGYSSSSSNKDGAILNDRALDVDVNGIGGFVEKFWNLFKY